MRSTFRKIGPKAFTLKPLLSLLIYLLDQVPDEGIIFNFCSIEMNLDNPREFRETVNADWQVNQFTARDNSKNWVNNAIGDWQLEMAAVR